MIFNDDFSNIDWQAVCEYQQARDFELQITQCQEWEPDPEEEYLKHWHSPAFIAMMKKQTVEKDRLLYLDF